jgi:hypothetical protein
VPRFTHPPRAPGADGAAPSRANRTAAFDSPWRAPLGRRRGGDGRHRVRTGAHFDGSSRRSASKLCDASRVG